MAPRGMASKGISVNLGGPRLLIRPGIRAGTAEMLAAAAAFNKLASFSFASFLRSFSSFTKFVAKLRPSPTTLSNPVKQ